MVLLQLAVAFVLFLPVLILGENFSHSDRFNHVWVTQFSNQFLLGDLYPRWLDDSFARLGAPAFYYYPPAFYWLAAFVHATSFGTIPADYQIPIAGALASFASGLSFFSLLRERVDAR